MLSFEFCDLLGCNGSFRMLSLLISLFSAELPGIRIGLGRGQGSPSDQGGGGWLPFLEAAPAWTLQPVS